MSAFDLERFRETVKTQGAAFRAALPYPHLILDGYFRPEALRRVLAEFPGEGGAWRRYRHYNENKAAITDFQALGAATQALIGELSTPEFLRELEALSGVGGLLADPSLDGGGLHETRPGGYLNVHVDFLSHAKNKRWSRQINLLLYLNEDWPDAYGGFLELWDREVRRCAAKIPPLFNRMVIFQTVRNSFHGVPDPVRCPEGRTRKSLALYYFRDEGRVCKLESTNYRPRPQDRLHERALIAADRMLLRVYAFLKRYGGLADDTAAKFLKWF